MARTRKLRENVRNTTKQVSRAYLPIVMASQRRLLQNVRLSPKITVPNFLLFLSLIHEKTTLHTIRFGCI